MSVYKFCPLCSSQLEPKTFEGSLKQACSAGDCEFVGWDNPTPVVLALVELNGKFLVTHNVEWPSWKYSLISGFLDTNEDPFEAVKREIKEELGLTTSHVELITTSIYKNLNQLMISFHVKTEGVVVLNEEHDSYKLLTLEELKSWEFGSGAMPAIHQWLASSA